MFLFIYFKGLGQYKNVDSRQKRGSSFDSQIKRLIREEFRLLQNHFCAKNETRKVMQENGEDLEPVGDEVPQGNLGQKDHQDL